jgi:hypothetical protein
LLLRQYPSPQVDDAWEILTGVGVVIITEEEILRLGKDPKKAVKAPSKWGMLTFYSFKTLAHEATGYREKAFLAQLDGQHALHCLNAIRKYAYREHYYPSRTADLSSEHHVNMTSTLPLPLFTKHIYHIAFISYSKY